MFLSKYISLFTQNPIATTFVSVCVLVVAIHIITPIVCAGGNVFKRYWSRGKLGTSNAYFTWVGKLQVKITGTVRCRTRKFKLTRYEGLWCYTHKGAWFVEVVGGKAYDYHSEYLSKLDEKVGRIFFTTKDKALSAVSGGFGWDDWAISLFIGAAITLAACLSGLFLDFLVFNHLLQTIVVFAVAAGIWGTLAGGRMMYDLSEKVAVIDNAAKEIKQD